MKKCLNEKFSRLKKNLTVQKEVQKGSVKKRLEKNSPLRQKKKQRALKRNCGAFYIKLHLILKNDKICGVISTIIQLNVQ